MNTPIKLQQNTQCNFFQQMSEKIKTFGWSNLTREELVSLFNALLYERSPMHRASLLIEDQLFYRFVDEKILTNHNSEEFLRMLIDQKLLFYFMDNSKAPQVFEYAYSKNAFNEQQLINLVLSPKVHELYEEKNDKKLQDMKQKGKSLKINSVSCRSYNNSFLINFFIEHYKEDSYKTLMKIFDELNNFRPFISSKKLFFEYVFDSKTHSLRKDQRYHIDELFSRILSDPLSLQAFLSEYHESCYLMYTEFFGRFRIQYTELCKKLSRQKILELLDFILHRLEHACFRRNFMSESQLFKQYESLLKYCLTTGIDLQMLFENSQNFEKYCKDEYSTIQVSLKLVKRKEFPRDCRGQFVSRKSEYELNLHS